ncbi:MAG TPA: nucleotidyltransferase domain-containing protein [Mobilitalea sp.]|nr:nucleotidyltransferase domain-containing protein [Mobilitalea sp.]
MNEQIKKELTVFVNQANDILNGKIVSAYCFGSAIYDDFHEGYSDLDFFIIVDGYLSEADFNRFHLLRDEYKRSGNAYLSVLEGEIIPHSAMIHNRDTNVIYWGTSKDRLKSNYGLAGFSMCCLLDNGYLIFGKDIRNAIPYPTKEEMLGEISTLIERIRQHAC